MTAQYFNLNEMMAAAQRATGFDDWGDGNIREPLEILFKALNEEAEMDERGRTRAKSHINRLFTGRLQLFGDRKKYPEISHQEIHQPIFMAGLPRAGTTYLNTLIACDPNLLSLYRWQLMAPSPPPNHPAFDHEAQKSYAVNLMEADGWLDPEIRAKHDQHPLKTAEDTGIRDYSFISDTFAYFWHVPSYGAYYAKADRRPTFDILKKFLQTLQFGTTGKRWALKAPPHISQLGLLFETFPDARVVVNHRDPTRVMASLMSLQGDHRKQFGHPPLALQDRRSSLMMLEGMARGVGDMIRRRQADPEFNRFFVDVKYIDLEREPLKEVEKIYQGFDMKLGDDARAAMNAYIAKTRKGSAGFRRYRIEDCGLTAAEVRERFKLYFDYFDVPVES